MRHIIISLVLTTLVQVGGTASVWAESLELDADTDECELFRALNGSAAVPERCEDDSKTTFVAVEEPQAVILSSINFDFGSRGLKSSSRAALQKLAVVMRDPSSEGQRYVLEGHADLKGDPGVNLRLSRQRADSARRFLLEAGVPRERLKSVGYGADRLLLPDEPYAAANRRVEIINQSAATGVDP